MVIEHLIGLLGIREWVYFKAGLLNTRERDEVSGASRIELSAIIFIRTLRIPDYYRLIRVHDLRRRGILDRIIYCCRERVRLGMGVSVGGVLPKVRQLDLSTNVTSCERT